MVFVDHGMVCQPWQKPAIWIDMVFNETTNHDFSLLSKQGRTQLIYLTELTTEHVFENFGGELPGCSPPDCGTS